MTLWLGPFGGRSFVVKLSRSADGRKLTVSGIDAIYVFGSRAREIYRRAAKGFDDVGSNREGSGKSAAEESDVDIDVQLRRGSRLSARERVELAIALEDLLGVARVDLVILQEADPFLALDIIKGELLYCGDPDSQAEYELYVLRRAGDLAPFEYERRRQVLEAAGR